jgi:hypothetical protein
LAIASATSITNSTAATSTSTGALVVSGGVGIGGNVYAGSGIQNTPIGSFTPNIGIFTALSATNSTTSTSTTTGALTVTGGAGIGGNIYAGAVYDSIGNLRDFTLNTQTASYTLVATDDGKMINTTANVIIPTSVFTAGQTVTVYNNSGSNIYVTSSGTVYSAGTNLTGTRILAQRGLGTIVCVATNTFVISGAGLY